MNAATVRCVEGLKVAMVKGDYGAQAQRCSVAWWIALRSGSRVGVRDD